MAGLPNFIPNDRVTFKANRNNAAETVNIGNKAYTLGAIAFTEGGNYTLAGTGSLTAGTTTANGATLTVETTVNAGNTTLTDTDLTVSGDSTLSADTLTLDGASTSAPNPTPSAMSASPSRGSSVTRRGLSSLTLNFCAMGKRFRGTVQREQTTRLV